MRKTIGAALTAGIVVGTGVVAVAPAEAAPLQSCSSFGGTVYKSGKVSSTATWRLYKKSDGRRCAEIKGARGISHRITVDRITTDGLCNRLHHRTTVSNTRYGLALVFNVQNSRWTDAAFRVGSTAVKTTAYTYNGPTAC